MGAKERILAEGRRSNNWDEREILEAGNPRRGAQPEPTRRETGKAWRSGGFNEARVQRDHP